MTTFEELMRSMNDPSTARGRNHLRYVKAHKLRHRVLEVTMGRIPIVGGVLYTFYDGLVGDHPDGPLLSPSGAVNALSFSHLGDFLFWHQPMTEDYERSWLARVPWPRRLHIHVAPCVITGWRDDEGNHHAPNTVCSRRS